MAEATFYVRSRGKISGPYDIVALQKLVRRGLLARIGEISQDRATWNRAGDYDELFPSKSGVAEESSAVENVALAAAVTTVPETAASADEAMYFYLRGGAPIGPVSLPILQLLARQGALQTQELCWSQGSEFSTPAGKLPELFASFIARDAATGGQPGSAAIPAAGKSLPYRRILSETNLTCQIVGIIVGFSLLLCLNLPIGIVNGQTQWWWSIIGQPHTGAAPLLLFYILFAALAAGLVGAIVRGLVRAWTFIGISALSFILFFVSGLNESAGGGELFFSLTVFYLSAALLGLALFRTKVQDAPAGRMTQAIMGGGLLFCILIVAILSVTRAESLEPRRMLGTDSLPGWCVLAITIGIVGVGAAVAASILGLCAARRTFSRAVNSATIGNAAAAIILPLVAAFIVVCGVANAIWDRDAAMIIFLSFRVLAIFAAFVALMSAGFFELFIASHVTAPPARG
jgi:hypothetical protein